MSNNIEFKNGNIKLPLGTYSERPSSPSEGTVRLNNSDNNMEGYVDNYWTPLNNKTNLYDNAIINGNMEIWQDGTSFAAIASGSYTTDMWKYEKSGTMVHTVSRDTDTPNDQFNYSLKIDTTTKDDAIGAGDYSLITDYIEGYDFKKFVEKYITLSFWVKSVVTGTYCISFLNSGNDRTYIAEYTINSASTWEYKTITILCDETGGTWDYTNGIGIRIRFFLDNGVNIGTADSWLSGNYHTTSNQVNFSASTDNNFWITGVQLNEGTSIIFNNPRSFEEELKLCQRYYEKTYDYGTYAGNVTAAGAAQTFTTITKFNESIGNRFRIRKRTTPSVTLYATDSGTSGKIRNRSDNTDLSGTPSYIGETGFYIAATSTANKHYGWHWIANARF